MLVKRFAQAGQHGLLLGQVLRNQLLVLVELTARLVEGLGGRADGLVIAFEGGLLFLEGEPGLLDGLDQSLDVMEVSSCPQDVAFGQQGFQRPAACQRIGGPQAALKLGLSFGQALT